MKQRKDRLIIKWNREVKTYLAIFLLLIFSSGAVVGMFAGKAMASKACEATDEPATETVIETTTKTPNTFPEKIYEDCPLSADLQAYISEQCEANDVPLPLVMAIIEVESAFDEDAISDTDDYGLMQINKINHERFTNEYGFKSFLEPYQNVFCGITIIAEHYAEYEDIDMALMAYNLGASGARELWDMGTYQTDYTEEVRTAMEAYEVESK